MSTFLDFLIESATENAAIIALAGLVAALLTYIFRRTIREQDAMATKIEDVDAGLIRLASDTERNETYWKLSRQVQTESLKAVIGQVEAVSVRQNFLEANVTDTRNRLSTVESDYREMEKGHVSLERGQEEVKKELNGLERGHEEVKNGVNDLERGYQGVKKELDVLERGHEEVKNGVNDLERGYQGVRKELDGMAKTHEEMTLGYAKARQLLQDSDGSLADFLEQSALMREDLGVLRTELLRLVDVLESAD